MGAESHIRKKVLKRVAPTRRGCFIDVALAVFCAPRLVFRFLRVVFCALRPLFFCCVLCSGSFAVLRFHLGILLLPLLLFIFSPIDFGRHRGAWP